MPYISVITIAYNEIWALTKTMRSVFEQRCKDSEYLIVDRFSSDATRSLIDFWQTQGLIDHFICEPDDGVYDAMNKAV